jgi:hypothetical protein
MIKGWWIFCDSQSRVWETLLQDAYVTCYCANAIW